VKSQPNVAEQPLPAFYFLEIIKELGERKASSNTNSQQLLDSLIELVRRIRLNPNGKLRALSRIVAQQLEDNGATHDVARLQTLGFRIETLAVGVFFIKGAPFIDSTLRNMFGNAREKKRKSKILYEALDVLNGIGKYVTGLDTGLPHEFLEDAGFPLPSTAAYGLSVYANLLFMRELILGALDANSGVEIAKYTLASAVYRITGGYHDHEVSGIIGAANGVDDYDETAHRVWRIRTCRRLNCTVYGLPILLQAINTVLNESQHS
jgi:hypothetical protein